MTEKNRHDRRAMRWVIAQIPLLAATITVPVAQVMLHASGPWIGSLAWPTRIIGGSVLIVAVQVFRAARRMLGAALVATPMPVQDATLRDTGIYGVVRHPIYLAIICGVTGWALLWSSAVGVALAVVCSLFFLAKSRYEEGLLAAAFPAYGEYRKRVPALLPIPRNR